MRALTPLSVKDSVFYTNHTLNLGGKILSMETPLVMGIVNVTPDSFYDGGSSVVEKDLLSKVETMLDEGATLLDVGGYSSRPGALDISEEEEAARVVPAIKSILNHFPEALISVDTFRSPIAKRALDVGALMVNDISGGELDGDMHTTVARYNVPYVVMHMRGTPQTMSSLVNYDNLIFEIMNYFQVKIFKLRSLGVSDIIIDPGFGFSKTREQSFTVLRNLSVFHQLGCPMLVGVSRKSMISKSLDIDASQALNGTTVLNTIALQKGASILRVHDVREAVQAVKLLKLL